MMKLNFKASLAATISINRSVSKLQQVDMEVLPHHRDTSPSWVLLNSFGSRKDDATIVGDARTVADSCTSTGHPFRVSFGLAPPPASSYLNYTWLGATGPPRADTSDRPRFVAAHNDVVLFELRTLPTPQARFYHSDYFLYQAAGPARPPSLSLLPACYIPMQYERHRCGGVTGRREDFPRIMEEKDTVVLRRRDGDLFVAQLEVSYGDEESNEALINEMSEVSDDDDEVQPEAVSDDEDEVPEAVSDDDDVPAASRRVRRMNFELCVFRPGVSNDGWELKQAVPIVYGDGESASGGGIDAKHLPDWQWQTDAAIPVSDRFLCFVDFLRGILVCDTVDLDRPLTLRYVPLPLETTVDRGWRGRPRMNERRNLSAAAGAAQLRLVSIDSRCCCGGPGRTSCARGRFAFTVTTWTLSLMAGNGEASATGWVKDGVLDCEEVWGLPAYQGIPRVHLENPIASPDNANVVCFTVCNDSYASSREKKVWTVEVDMRSKEVLSAMPCTIDPWRADSRAAVKLNW
ncbi:unnamed protein product [Urochloa decumbens]|uniref:DUF1618 domain-containing protein n=1 Tax=Urochloa decumbens TaxID=240449 RepID=A0ABC9B6M1_9POAL